ncbi:MAG: 4Fe-4S dicluster domain-containing protein [Desulfobacterales bacterium]
MAASIEDKLFLNRFNVDENSHLKITNDSVCIDDCYEQPCLYICPANVYQLEQNRISVNYEGCLECGSCRIGCPHFNIEWKFPTGGYGIRHKFG